MSALIDRLFTSLFGWAGQAANNVWQLIAGGRTQVGQFLSYLWIPVLIALLAFGTMMDYFTWLMRWKPFARMMLRRKKKKEDRLLAQYQKAERRMNRRQQNAEDWTDAAAFDAQPVDAFPPYGQADAADTAYDVAYAADDAVYQMPVYDAAPAYGDLTPEQAAPWLPPQTPYAPTAPMADAQAEMPPVWADAAKASAAPANGLTNENAADAFARAAAPRDTAPAAQPGAPARRRRSDRYQNT